MPAVEGLQQERRALSPERDLALPFSRGGELRGRSHTWRLCTSPYSCSVSPGPRPLLSQMRRSWAQTYAVLHYHNPCMAMVRVSRAGATRGRARSKWAYVPLPTWWPLRAQAARGGLLGGGRLGGSEGRLSGGADRLALRLLHLQGDGSIGDLYVRSPTWR